MPRRYLQATVLALAFSLPGCAPPEVSLMHMIPGAMPLPTTVREVQVETITVYPSAGIDPGIAQEAADQLERLTAQATGSLDLPPTQPPSAARRVVVDGEAWLTLTDHQGQRVVRLYSNSENRLQDVTLPSLVREASLKVDYRVRLADGTDQGIIEVRRSYSSLDDPEVRGPLGLERGDDPARVPAASIIVRQLARESAEQLAGLLKPVVLAAVVQLQPASGPDAREGFSAVKRGDLAAAVEHFDRALVASPGDANLQFDLAVVAEALGRFQQAEPLYEAVAGNVHIKRSLREAAREGQRRARRMLLVTAPPTSTRTDGSIWLPPPTPPRGRSAS